MINKLLAHFRLPQQFVVKKLAEFGNISLRRRIRRQHFYTFTRNDFAHDFVQQHHRLRASQTRRIQLLFNYIILLFHKLRSAIIL